MNKLCARCGKPVFFAERKSSLGKEWHPSCLRCTECGRVLSPGQHAEHKTLPYCHNCYKALFGPSILGYGSNISTPANFARKDKPASHGHDSDPGFYDRQREIFSSQRSSPVQIRKSVNGVDIVSSPQTSRKDSQKSSPRESPRVSPKPQRNELDPFLKELLKKIQDFNKFHEGKVRHQMTAEQHDDGTVEVRGPLRIYWGLSSPIQLAHCDDIPPPPISQWRHSLYTVPSTPSTPSTPTPEVSERELLVNSLQCDFLDLGRTAPSKTRDMDDLDLQLSTADDVKMRKKRAVRKFKTVAYRGDQPTRWKRASINGHMFNYDTSVFTPVLGSCTSVSVHGEMNTQDVVDVLLDKFKVQNSPEEYDLYFVNDKSERLLTNSDKPLLERLKVGADESNGKIFIRERQPGGTSSGPIMSPAQSLTRRSIAEPVEEEHYTYEVEQLLCLPEAVLLGVLAKYMKDEEAEISLIKARYQAQRNQIDREIKSRLTNMMTHQTSSIV